MSDVLIKHAEALGENEALKVMVAVREAENKRLRAALHRISLGSQNSGTTKEDLGREAKQALEGDKT